jgi:hypothetical protein
MFEGENEVTLPRHERGPIGVFLEGPIVNIDSYKFIKGRLTEWRRKGITNQNV